MGGGGAARLRARPSPRSLLAAWLAPNSTESAVANGDTRTVTFSNQHTSEEGSFTYMVNGEYDQGALDKLNWFMRDWRLNEPTKMDPHLFDIIWEVYRESGSRQPINVFSAYRSPQTNAMLRRRSRQVAEHSQHMEGKAIDAHFEDVGPGRIRDIAMRMQEGGVGFYPQGLTWVHIDSGSVRYWPKMSREALTRLFPDGKTVFIPADGQPMPGYDLAKAEIEQRGGQIQTASGGGLFAWLFGARGGGADDAEEAAAGRRFLSPEPRRPGRGRDAPGRRSGPGRDRGSRSGCGRQSQARPADWPRLRGSGAVGAPAPAPAPPSQARRSSRARGAEGRERRFGRTAGQAQRTHRSALSRAPAATASSQSRTAARLARRHSAAPRAACGPASSRRRPRRRPCRPARPAHLALLPADMIGSPDVTASIGAPAAPPVVAVANATATAPSLSSDDGEELPSVITKGLRSPPPSAALALAELPASPIADKDALLERASELTAPLPPMPIPNAGAVAAQSAPVVETEPEGGFVARVARLFRVFKPKAGPDDLRGPQQ